VVTCRLCRRTAAFAERNDGLHRAFAEAGHADDGGALVILQSTGDDFRRRGGAAVDQDYDRLAVGDVAGLGVIALGVVGMTAAGRHDLALGEEVVGDLHCLIQEAAGIVPEIDDIALEVGDLLLQFLDRLLEAAAIEKELTGFEAPKPPSSQNRRKRRGGAQKGSSITTLPPEAPKPRPQLTVQTMDTPVVKTAPVTTTAAARPRGPSHW